MTRPYRVLSLFAGIGGFDLGLERTGGFKTVAFCDIDPFCRRVLAKHWPEVPCYHDVRELTAERLAADGIAVDCIVGGFPCQDISLAGTGAGLAGERSGLWAEYARLIGALRPRFVIVENVAALLGRGLGDVLGDLAAIGYDAEWHCIPAASVGAHHRRDRLWIMAYPETFGCGSGRERGPYPSSERQSEQPLQALADTTGERRGEAGSRKGWGWFAGRCETVEHGWDAEPDVGRVAHGVSSRVDRLRALGNAVVPQIPELIGRAILAAERQHEQTTDSPCVAPPYEVGQFPCAGGRSGGTATSGANQSLGLSNFPTSAVLGP